jgi:hypothetical protein
MVYQNSFANGFVQLSLHIVQTNVFNHFTGWRRQDSWINRTHPMTLFIYLVFSCCMKMCKVAYRSKIASKLNQHNQRLSKHSIQRYCIHLNKSLENMHFWKMTGRMTDNNFCDDPVHLLHSLCIYACAPSSWSKITGKRNHAYRVCYVHLFYLLRYKLLNWQGRSTITWQTNRHHPVQSGHIATSRFCGSILTTL